MAFIDSMGQTKVELLAPAGNYESFLGAIHAGADAVYLGGEKFGARAYADNFTEEEICRGIHYAHIFGRKVYLTVNTLIKDSEFGELVPYLTPFYEAGLDGVIVQDMGALLAIRDVFPGLELHASTQMTVTGSYGAELLKELGVVRIVPARELSLEEIVSLKKETGLEIEAFIHGAMCYCYSGQCLFSSLLGGRSGNRGRCAQPCRLPYHVLNDGKSGEECYPLSLKDMCTIACLPDLIEAGIDSFKIEGRMKKPEYAAGVTAIYRKYIDLYERCGREGYRVSEQDMQTLRSLYIRTGIQDGYYFKHNGADMVTLTSPAYSGSSEEVLERIRHEHLEMPLKREISMEASFAVGVPAKLTLTCETGEECASVTVYGEVCQKAEKQPVTSEKIKTGLLKLGNSFFAAKEENVRVFADEALFFPFKSINELRRAGVEALEEKLCPGRTAPKEKECGTACMSFTPDGNARKKQLKRRVLISTEEQFDGLLHSGYPVELLYLEASMVKKSVGEYRARLVEAGIECPIFLALPYIVRKKDVKELNRLSSVMEEADGCLVRNMESFHFLKKKGYQKPVFTDAGVYCFNRKTCDFWLDRADGICLPYELNRREISVMTEPYRNYNMEKVVYGRIPLMITANCVGKTMGRCLHKEGAGVVLSDRYQKKFPVVFCCKNCYNLIYNSVPLSLHKQCAAGEAETAWRLSFTVESGAQTEQILRFFKSLPENPGACPPYAEYTTGHEKRGVL